MRGVGGPDPLGVEDAVGTDGAEALPGTLGEDVGDLEPADRDGDDSVSEPHATRPASGITAAARSSTRRPRGMRPR